MGKSSNTSFPKALNILVIGAGCAGPAFAISLLKTMPAACITVIERNPSLRTGGQQIDLKGPGITITRDLGLLEDLKDVCVRETGLTIINGKGRPLIHFGVNAADEKIGQGPALTNEFEFMRGDMVKLLYNASLAERKRLDELDKHDTQGDLLYRFDTTITALEQGKECVTVTFSTGEKARFDLVVAADGQNSRTRRMAFGEDTNSAAFRSMGIHCAYYSIPRLSQDNNDAHIYFGSDGRAVMTRTGDRDAVQVYFFAMKDADRHERLKIVHKQPITQQKEEWANIFKGAGYECERFLSGLESAEDFYAHEVGQVRMQQHYKGRVVLLGDAGYCPSPFTGMGTTLSLVGSRILAGELAKHGEDVDAALAAYDGLIQVPLAEFQRLNAISQLSFLPTSAFGIGLFNWALWTMAVFRINLVLIWLGSLFPESKATYALPEYPGLGL